MSGQPPRSMNQKRVAGPYVGLPCLVVSRPCLDDLDILSIPHNPLILNYLQHSENPAAPVRAATQTTQPSIRYLAVVRFG